MKKESLKLDCNDLLQGKMSDQKRVSMLYDRCRDEFIAFVCLNFSLDKSQAIELYQECFVALYENVHSGKLTELTCSVKTYLFRIAKNKMFNRWRDHKPHVELSEQISMCDEDWSDKEHIAYDVVQQMGEPCKRVLLLYYWDQLSMEQIATQMNYSSAQVAKNRKLMCMTKLKSTLTTRLLAEGILELNNDENDD